MPNLIECHHLGFRYPDGTRALRSIDLIIGNNEFIALIGQNGSGKTTLAKCLGGLLKPTEGTISLHGKQISSNRSNQLSPTIGYVFQNPDHQIFQRTVWDELAMGPINKGLSNVEVDRIVKSSSQLGAVSESSLRSHPLLLSKGLRQRVAFSSILAMEPQCFIIDEPSTGQDYPHALELMEIVRSLWRERNMTIVVVTNDMRFAAPYAVRTIAMFEGNVLADGPTGQIMSQREILALTMVEPPQAARLALSLVGLEGSVLPLTVDDLKKQFPVHHK